MNPWLDVTRPIFPGMPVWPGDPPIEMYPLARIDEGAVANVSRWHLGTHTGTHVDPPLHFLSDGAPVQGMPMESLCGEAWVLNLRPSAPHVTAIDLARAAPEGATRLLLKTRNSGASAVEFQRDFVALEPEAAQWMAEHGIVAIGIDGPSIEAFDARDFRVHRTILGAGIAVIEGLDLSAAEAGRYEMVCAPLPLRDADGAPARVLLREWDAGPKR